MCLSKSEHLCNDSSDKHKSLCISSSGFTQSFSSLDSFHTQQLHLILVLRCTFSSFSCWFSIMNQTGKRNWAAHKWIKENECSFLTSAFFIFSSGTIPEETVEDIKGRIDCSFKWKSCLDFIPPSSAVDTLYSVLKKSKLSVYVSFPEIFLQQDRPAFSNQQQSCFSPENSLRPGCVVYLHL